MRSFVLPLSLAGTLALSPLAMAHFDDKEIPQSYRQSYFALVAGNFGPLVAMLKGEMPWDDAKFKAYADDLAKAASLNYERGFPDANQPGQTRAKAGIWDNKEDFVAKLNDLRRESMKLAEAAGGSDKKAIMNQFKATGGTCKACHDEYKSKDYLY